MYTEYVFDDKKYDVALKNLKSIIFDIVNSEECKLSDIMQKVVEAEDSDMKNQLIDLCNTHKENIYKIFEAFNVLDDLMKKIDTFSKDIRELENESVAEIVSNYIEQQHNENNNGTNQNVSGKEQVDSKIEESIDKQDMQVTPSDESIDKQENVDNNNPNPIKVEDDQVNNNQVMQEASSDENINKQENVDNNNSNPIKVEDDQVNNNQVMQEASSDENIDKQENLTDNNQNQIELENNHKNDDNQIRQIDGQHDVIDNNMGTSSSEESEETVHEIIPSVSNAQDDGKIFNQDIMEQDNNSEVQEEVVDIFSQNQDNLNKDKESKQDNSIIFDNNDNSAVKTSDIEKPVMDVSSVESVSENLNPVNDTSLVNDSVDVQNNTPILNPKSEELISVQENGINSDQSDVSSNIDETGAIIPVISDTNGDILDSNSIFEKKDMNEPKAILTTANQVSKLRNSRDNNESILTAKQFFKITKSTEDGNSLTPNNYISLDNTVDTNLNTQVDSSQEISKEKQMEIMMQQITDFYKEGKVEEAQALSDKVSELNKEIQQSQKTLAA